MARLTDNGQTDQKTDDGQNIQKYDTSVEKYILHAEHIFLGTTSCTHLGRLLQIELAHGKTPVEHILQKYSS